MKTGQNAYKSEWKDTSMIVLDRAVLVPLGLLQKINK